MASVESLESLDTAALAAKLEEVTRVNDFLRQENGTLHAYLHRHVSAEEAEEWADEDNRRGRKGKGRKLRVTTLSIDQKLDIATAESDAVKKETTAFDAHSSKQLDSLRAVLEQTDQRIATLKREAYEFKRDVVIAGENARTGKTMAEKVMKYYDDQMRSKDGIVDKLRLKNQSLRTQLIKLESSMKQKDEVGDVLHYIDFHQLQIENKQYLAKIEEKNTELLRLKLSTGQTVQNLNAMKLKLGEVTKESSRLRGEIRGRFTLLQRLKADNSDLSLKVAEAHDLGQTLSKAVRESVDMPTIMDYVELKALEANLQKEVASWARKLEVMELTARQTSLKLKAADTLAGAHGRASGRFIPAATGQSLHSLPASPMRAPSAGSALSSTLGTAAATRVASRGTAQSWRPSNAPSASALVGPKGVGGFGGTKSGGVLYLGTTRGSLVNPTSGQVVRR